jgi:hypothetical protein
MKLENAFAIVVLALGLAIIGFLSWAVVGSVKSNGVIDYCYVQMWSPSQMAPQYALYGHRPWREDRQMGVYPTIEEAKAKADSMGCRLNTN